MPVSSYMPDVVVEIAFDSGFLTPAVSRTWTDVSAYVEASSRISINRGRPDQFSTAQPSRLSLTLDNRDGRFTPENASGAYYPNVKKGRPIRVRVKPVGAGSYVTRFTGYIDEWPVEWPTGNSTYSAVAITATSRMARLGKSAEFKSIIEEEMLYDGPTYYAPLGEPSGATTAGNIAPGRSEVMTATQFGTGGTLAFGQGTGPGTDDLTAPMFQPVDSANGLFLRMAPISPLATGTNGFIEVEFFVATSTASQLVAKLPYFSSTLAGLRILIDSSGFPVAHADLALNATTIVQATSSTNVADGSTHHVSCRWVMSGTDTVTPSVMVDGGTRVTGTPTSGAALTNPLGIRFVDFGGHGFVPGATVGSGTGAFEGTLSHLSIFTGVTPLADVEIAGHANAGLNGFTTDASGARIQRYARLAGIPTAEVTVETGLSTSIAHKDTTGESPLDLMQAVAETEDGVLFDAGDGTLTFHARSHRYGSTSSFTLNCNAGDIEAGLMPRLDDQNLTNDVTASRRNGITARSTNPASIAEYGYYRESVEILTTSDNEVQARADWQAQRFGTPRVTIPDVSVDLISCASGLITSLIAADIGTRLTLSNLPSQAPATTKDFFIEGISEEIGAESYTISLNTSAADYANVWTLDSAAFSQLDSTTVLAY